MIKVIELLLFLNMALVIKVVFSSVSYIVFLYLALLSVFVFNRFRQYGLWDRYTELYPDEDLVYTVNISNYQNDWFFAQVTRKVNNTYQGTTWQIKFQLDKIYPLGTYYLRLALASATSSDLQVRINNRHENPPLFSTGQIGYDNTIARHGSHGLYWLYNVTIPGSKFLLGNNTIFLTQVLGLTPWAGILYDYIRLESPFVDTY